MECISKFEKLVLKNTKLDKDIADMRKLRNSMNIKRKIWEKNSEILQRFMKDANLPIEARESINNMLDVRREVIDKKDHPLGKGLLYGKI